MLFPTDRHTLRPVPACATPAPGNEVFAGKLPAPGVSSQAVRGGAYLAARYGLGVFVSLGNMLVMTRWIGPHSYGVFVTAIGLAAFLSTLARAGLDTYLVRSDPAPEKRTYDIASTLIFGISSGLALAGVAVAPLLIAGTAAANSSCPTCCCSPPFLLPG